MLIHGPAELVLALLIAVAALVTIARRLEIAYPIFLVIGGLILGLVPGVPRIHIDPDMIFLIVLPPLLYIAAFYTPIQNLRANLGHHQLARGRPGHRLGRCGGRGGPRAHPGHHVGGGLCAGRHRGAARRDRGHRGHAARSPSPARS